ncbi:hypothetical protein D9M72_297240 [compost metagenome]
MDEATSSKSSAWPAAPLINAASSGFAWAVLPSRLQGKSREPAYSSASISTSGSLAAARLTEIQSSMTCLAQMKASAPMASSSTVLIHCASICVKPAASLPP